MIPDTKVNFREPFSRRRICRQLSPPALSPIKTSTETRAGPIQPRLTPESLVCLLFSSIYIFHGSYGTHARTSVPASIVYDMCSAYKAISRSVPPPDYRDYIIPNARLSRLTCALEEPLQLAGFVKLLGRLGNRFFWILFVTAMRWQYH